MNKRCMTSLNLFPHPVSDSIFSQSTGDEGDIEAGGEERKESRLTSRETEGKRMDGKVDDKQLLAFVKKRVYSET